MPTLVTLVQVEQGHRVQCLITSKGAKKDLTRYHSTSEVFLTNDYRTE